MSQMHTGVQRRLLPEAEGILMGKPKPIRPRTVFDQAACSGTGTELWYEERMSKKHLNVRDLRAVCMNCPALQPCAEYAVVWEEWGFWGGMTPNERRAIRKQQGIPLHDPSRWW